MNLTKFELLIYIIGAGFLLNTLFICCALSEIKSYLSLIYRELEEITPDNNNDYDDDNGI